MIIERLKQESSHLTLILFTDDIIQSVPEPTCENCKIENVE